MHIFGVAVVFFGLVALVASQITFTISTAALAAAAGLAGAAALGTGAAFTAAAFARSRRGGGFRRRRYHYYRGRRNADTADILPLDSAGTLQLEKTLGPGKERLKGADLDPMALAFSSRVMAILKEDDSGCGLQLVCHLASPGTVLGSNDGLFFQTMILSTARKPKQGEEAPQNLKATDDSHTARLVGEAGGNCDLPKCALKSEALLSAALGSMREGMQDFYAQQDNELRSQN